jgi:integrase
MIIEEYRSIMPFSEGSKGYKSQYLDELGKAFPKNQKVAALKTSDMTRHIASYQERMAPATINKVITLLRDVFRHALHDRAIAFSPMEGIKYQKNRDTKKRLIPTLGEFEAIVESIRSQSLSDTAKESGDLVEFMGLAGLGQAECAGLKWGDINFQSGIITIIRAKTGHQFDFPIYPTLRPLLDRLHAQRPKEAQGGPQNATDPVFHVYNPKVALENACARLGLPNYTARSLRRMHITRCLELGIDPQTIAAWQGHRDGGQLILRTYGRVSKAHQMNMAARLSPKITTMAQGGLAGQA